MTAGRGAPRRVALWRALGGLALAPALARGQASLPPPPQVADDSAFLAVPAPSPWRQRLAVRLGARRYVVDEAQTTDSRLTETTGGLAYALRGPRLAVRINLQPVRYAARTHGAGADRVIAGFTPAAVRLDWAWRPGDTTRVTWRGAARPAQLDSAQSVALGIAGTSTIDLDAVAFGTQPVASLRHSHVVAVAPAWRLDLHGALDVSPSPAGTAFTYWTGTTGRIGASVTRLVGDDGRLAVAADLSRSDAGDLGGRNLFPGGGTIGIAAQASGSLGDRETRSDAVGRYGVLQLFWQRPFANPNADVLTRLIPQGAFAGASGSLSFDLGRVEVGPQASWLVETSSAEGRYTVGTGVRALQGELAKTGRGTAAMLGLIGTLDLPRGLTLSVDATYTAGAVHLQQRQRIALPGRPGVGTVTRRDNTIRGGALLIELTARW